MKNLWLYRVLETDSEGDPIDHGVARADSEEALTRMINARLTEILGAGSVVSVRLYPLEDAPDGILENRPYTKVYFVTA